MNSKEAYVTRMASATPAQMIIITYEILLDFIDEAKDAESEKEYRYFLKKSQAAVDTLMSGLDMQYEMSSGLLDLYVWINQRLIQAYYNREIEILGECRGILVKLLDSWREAEKYAKNQTPMLDSSQQIYAGLTYRKGNLDEYIDEDQSKGFRA